MTFDELKDQLDFHAFNTFTRALDARDLARVGACLVVARNLSDDPTMAAYYFMCEEAEIDPVYCVTVATALVRSLTGRN